MGVHLTVDMIQGAKRTEEMYGVPSSVTLGQIMLESGGSNPGGLSWLAYKYNNLFGITSGSNWNGETIKMSNKAGNDTKTYRVYENVSDCIEDHAKVLMNERYTKYTSKAKTVEEYVNGVASGGYAEDPDYSLKLKNIIKNNNLTAYDGDSWVGKSGALKGDGDVDSVDSSVDTDLKFWGDIVVVVLSVLLVGVGLVFFLSAFGAMPEPKFLKTAKKLGGGSNG